MHFFLSVRNLKAYRTFNKVARRKAITFHLGFRQTVTFGVDFSEIRIPKSRELEYKFEILGKKHEKPRLSFRISQGCYPGLAKSSHGVV